MEEKEESEREKTEEWGREKSHTGKDRVPF